MRGAVNCPLAEQKSWMTDPATITLELSLKPSKSSGPLTGLTHQDCSTPLRLIISYIIRCMHVKSNTAGIFFTPLKLSFRNLH